MPPLDPTSTMMNLTFHSCKNSSADLPNAEVTSAPASSTIAGPIRRGRGQLSLVEAFPFLKDEVGSFVQREKEKDDACAQADEDGREDGDGDGVRSIVLSAMLNSSLSALQEEALLSRKSDDKDHDERQIPSKEEDAGEAQLDEEVAQDSANRPRRLAALRDRSLAMVQNVIGDELRIDGNVSFDEEDGKEEGKGKDCSSDDRELQPRSLDRQTSQRAAYLLRRVSMSLASSLASEASSCRTVATMSSCNTANSCGIVEEKAGTLKDPKEGEEARNSSVMEQTGGSSTCDQNSANVLEGALARVMLGGLHPLGPAPRKEQNRSQPVHLNQKPHSSSTANGQIDSSEITSLADVILRERVHKSRKGHRALSVVAERVARRIIHKGSSSASDTDQHQEESAATEQRCSAGTIDPSEYLWDSHDFVNRLCSDSSLPSASVRALNLQLGRGPSSEELGKVPTKTLERKMSSGRLYLMILEDWNERRDGQLRKAAAATLAAAAARKGGCWAGGNGAIGGTDEKRSDRTIGSATECLWSDRSLASAGGVSSRTSMKFCCGGVGIGVSGVNYVHNSRSVRALDLDVEGTAERIFASRKVISRAA